MCFTLMTLNTCRDRALRLKYENIHGEGWLGGVERSSQVYAHNRIACSQFIQNGLHFKSFITNEVFPSLTLFLLNRTNERKKNKIL